MNVRTKLLGSALALVVGIGATRAQQEATNAGILRSDHPAIDYSNAATTDAAEILNRRIAAGQIKLDYRNDGTGYLDALLRALDIRRDSQVLVFSKTSFQASRIGPRQPRAIYFNDNATVGFVQGSDVLEVATLDPKQGYIFYTFENRKLDKPVMDRRDVCLQCHHGPATAGVPGIMVASVFPDSSGMPFARAGMPATDHRTRFEERWGGWYVTGTHGGLRHRGNAVARDRNAPDVLESRDTQNQASLSKKFDIAPYLEPTSDIVALLTLEHQTRMTNLLTRVGWQIRMGAEASEDIRNTITYMLFGDEAPLADQVQGSSKFTETFTARGPKDGQGRSLREFDLRSRLFRYPLSYMIYSEAFDALPKVAQDRIYAGLLDVLTAQTPPRQYARLDSATRRAILEIVAATKSNIPANWRKAAGL
jgi:hypothetical protein